MQSPKIELYELLEQHSDVEDAEVVWRLARAVYEMGQHSKDSEQRKRFMYEAYDYIQKAMILDDKNFAVHKVGIFLLTDIKNL